MGDRIIPSPYKTCDLPEIHNENFGARMLSIIGNYGDKVAETNYETGEELTYKEIQILANKFTKYLKESGLTVGDTIAVVRQHSIGYISLLLGALQLGIAVCPLEKVSNVDEFVRRFNLVKPLIILVDVDSVDNVTSAVELLITKQQDFDWNKVKIVLSSLLSLVEDVSEDFTKLPEFDVDQTVSLIIFSSGTTGLPKGVMLTHKSFLVREAQIRHGMLRMASENPTGKELLLKGEGFPISTIIYFPNFHMSGNVILFIYLLMGGHVIFTEKFDEKVLLRIIQKYKVTSIAFCPYYLQCFIQYKHLEDYDVSSLKEIFCGGTQLFPRTKETVFEKMKTHVFESFGLTEGGTALISESYFPIKKGSIGRLHPYVKAKIICSKTGNSLGPGVEGELCVKVPSMMLGYVLNPEATNAAIDKDGWLHTGDIMCYDEDGYLYYVNRKKDLIRVKMFEIAPKEVELALMTHDEVMEAVVIAVPYAATGEAPKAFVVLQKGSKVTPDDLFQHIKTQLDDYKYPNGGIEIVDTLPRSFIGKTLRRSLIENQDKKS